MLSNIVSVWTNYLSYVLESEFFVDSYDDHILQQGLELGTKDYPFRSLDDAFRTIFNNNYIETMNFIINIKHGSNLTIHSEDMPLILLNSNVQLQ